LKSLDLHKGVRGEWNPYASDLIQAPPTPRRLVTAVAAPIKNARAEPVGILVAAIPADRIARAIQNITQSDLLTISLVDASGVFLEVSGGKIRNLPSDAASFEPVRRVRSGEAGSGIFRRGRQELSVGYTPIRTLGWGLVVQLSNSVISRAVWDLERPLVPFGL